MTSCGTWTTDEQIQELRLRLKNRNPACCPALPGLRDADYINQVCSVNQDYVSQVTSSKPDRENWDTGRVVAPKDQGWPVLV